MEMDLGVLLTARIENVLKNSVDDAVQVELFARHNELNSRLTTVTSGNS